MTSAGQLTESLIHHLNQRGLHPRQEWLDSYVSTARLTTPISALVKTAEFRLLQSDITETLIADSAHSLPSRCLDATIQDQALQHPTVVQVLDVEDISRSRWSQIELIEQQERGEMTRGREIIRVVADSEDRGPPASESSKGPHKLLVQDVSGIKIYAFELSPVSGFGITMPIGSKLLIRTAHIARGMMLLESGNAELLGGHIKAWAEQWAKNRKQMLRSRIPGDSTFMSTDA